MFDSRPIGIFDSGMGGLSVLKEAKKKLKNENFIFFGDNLHAPYGIKSDNYVKDRCMEICTLLIDKYNCKAIIIACNTATSVAAEELRNKFNIPIIGMEPAINLACKGKINTKILSLATPLTISRKKYQQLCEKSNKNNEIISIPAPELVEIVENNKLNNEIINNQFQKYFDKIDMSKINSIVLGCTHFTYYKNWLVKNFPNISILDGNEGTINQLTRKIERNKSNNTGSIILLSSDKNKIELMKNLLNSDFI